MAIAVVVSGVPSVTMAGRFGRDPAEDTRFRDDVAFLTQLAISRKEPLALALPPVLIEQMARVAAGYETTAGVVVPSTDEVPVRYARMLDALRSTAATGTIDLIDVPYALPDLAGLDGIRAPRTSALHWTQTDAVSARSSARPQVR